MVKAFDSATLALLDTGTLAHRDLAIVTGIPGTWAFWSDVFNVQFPSAYPGVTFVGAGSLIEISTITQAVDSSVQTLTATLSGLASEVLTTVGEVNLHQLKVIVARALYDEGTRALVNVVEVFRGYIDRDEIRESGGEATLVLECVSRARELDRATNRKRSFADQQRTFPGDRGFEFTSKVASGTL